MRILIIGGGIIGVTTAYALGRRGHEVVVLEGEQGPGRQTSFANGGLLTPSMSNPWNTPGSWRILLSSLARSDAALQLRLRSLPALAGWGIDFLRNSTAATFERNTLINLRLSIYSLKVMDALRKQTNVEYGHSACGTLRIFRDAFALNRAVAAADRSSCQNLKFRKLSQEETVDLEPSLAPLSKNVVGALHYPDDESGNAYLFCTGLAEKAVKHDVEFRFGINVTSLEVHSGRVTGVLTDRERLVADKYVLAAGSYSTPLLRPIGINLPVRPVKGYSITIDQPPGELTLRTPIVDDQLHAVITPLEGAIRVAGTAEFAGYDLSLPPVRLRNLHRLLQSVLPHARFNPEMAKPWCGLRPISVDGVPIIGATPLTNLLLNTGHGHLGWTMAAGSAYMLADLICGAPPSIDPTPYALARFGTVRHA